MTTLQTAAQAVEPVNEDAARAAAWEILKPQLGTEGWTVGDHCNYLGFFGWGWEARRQYTHPAPPASGERMTMGDLQDKCCDALKRGERAELIHWLRERSMWDGMIRLIDAANMLESDVSLINEGNKAQQVAVPVPLSGYEISKWWASENGLEDCDMCIHGDFEKVVRAIEAHHKIGAKK